MKTDMFFVLLLCAFLPLSMRAESIDAANISSNAIADELLELVDRPVVGIEFQPPDLSDQLKDKFLALRTKLFRPAYVRQIINWYQETSGDTRFVVEASRSGSGVQLVVKMAQQPKVKQISIVGSDNFSQPMLLSLIDLKDGSGVDATLIDNAIKKLLSFYIAQGFSDAQVAAALDEQNNLIFQVSDGQPSIIGALSFSPIETIADSPVRRLLEKDLVDSFGVEVGQRYVKEKISEGLLSARNWLRAHDFLIARDPNVRTEKMPDGKIKIFVEMEYGPRIRFGFRENQRFSNRELQVQVSEVKEVSVGLDYIESVRRRIADLYHDVGLVNVKINTLVREDSESGIKYVSLIIDEGKRVKIANLKIDGIFSLSTAERENLFFSFAPRLVQRRYFQESGIQRAGELLGEYLRSQGYLSSKLEYSRIDYNQERTSVDVYLLFNEGVQTKVKEIQLNGFKDLNPEIAKQLLEQTEGKPFNVFAFEKGLVAIKDYYLDLGHLNTAITNEGLDSIVRYSSDQSQVSLQVDVDEGQPVRLGEIIVRGNSMTHTRVITRELPFISGDILTRPILKEAEDNIRKLNLFGSVLVRPIEHPNNSDVRDLLILVEETTPGSFELAPGFRSDLGFRAAAGFAYQNLGGWHRGISARAVANRRTEDYRFPEYSISFGFREPYFANWPVTFTTNLNFLKRAFRRFDANILRLSAGFRRELSRYFTGLMEYSYERSKISSPKPPYTSEDEGTNNIGAVIPGLSIDTRKDKFNPTNGIFSNSHFEYAANAFGTQRGVGYSKFTTNNSFYWSIFEDFVLALGLNYGFERSNIAGKKIPILKLFRLGGIGSIRGYKEDGIDVGTEKNITGTLSMINYRGELRFPVYQSFGAALFYDAGNLFVDHFVPFRVRASAGIGLRYNTAVGPVVLDLAKKLSTASQIGDTTLGDDTDRYRVHFSIGSF